MASATGCAGVQSTLDPAGPSARAIAAVWWWMLGGAALVTAGVLGAWLLAMRRRAPARPDASDDARTARDARRWIVGGGIVLPTTAIVALLAFGSPAGLHQVPVLASRSDPGDARGEPLRIDVVGRQWSWHLHYPASGVELHDELRLPVGRPVHVQLGSRDVIHSFWVPRLGGKLDAIPGRVQVVRLQADEPGVFRGQCAEFCGLHHAHMVMTVVAMPADEFDAWLAARAAARPAPPR